MRVSQDENPLKGTKKNPFCQYLMLLHMVFKTPDDSQTQKSSKIFKRRE